MFKKLFDRIFKHRTSKRDEQRIQLEKQRWARNFLEDLEAKDVRDKELSVVIPLNYVDRHPLGSFLLESII